MNILHISKYYYPFLGGVENVCKSLVEQIKSPHASVVCFNTGKDDKVKSINGHNIYYVGTNVTIARQAFSFSYWNMLRKAIIAERPDIIQFHWANPFPALIMLTLMKWESMKPKIRIINKTSRTKLVVHWHMDIIRQWYLYWAVKPIEKWLVKRADRIVVTSPQYLLGSKPLQHVKSKVRVVPNAIDEKNLELQPGDEDRINEIKAMYDNKPIVLFVGRHTGYKGLPHLIEAERFMHSKCVVVIAGEGEQTAMLKRKAQKSASGRIHFVGRLSDKDLRCYLHAASVFAFPSITKNEAFGVALAEAMYCYTPAVTFTIPGSGVNWVNKNWTTGIEIPNSDDFAYAGAIDKLVENPKLREKFAAAAHKRVSNMFLVQNMVKAMKKVYDEL